MGRLAHKVSKGMQGRATVIIEEKSVADFIMRSVLKHTSIEKLTGRSMAFLDGLETRLQADDTVTIHLAGARGYPGG